MCSTIIIHVYFHWACSLRMMLLVLHCTFCVVCSSDWRAQTNSLDSVALVSTLQCDFSTVAFQPQMTVIIWGQIQGTFSLFSQGSNRSSCDGNCFCFHNRTLRIWSHKEAGVGMERHFTMFAKTHTYSPSVSPLLFFLGMYWYLLPGKVFKQEEAIFSWKRATTPLLEVSKNQMNNLVSVK